MKKNYFNFCILLISLVIISCEDKTEEDIKLNNKENIFLFTNHDFKWQIVVRHTEPDYSSIYPIAYYEYTDTLTNEIIGDTLIPELGLTYKRIMSDHNVIVRHIQTEGEDGVLDIDITRYHEKRTTGLVRVDSIGEKVFYLSMNSFNERLLYDFSLNIGDTIIYNEYSSNVFYSNHLEISDNIYSSDKFIVQSIDTLELGDFKLKRYNLNFGEYMEGIGSKLGIPYMGNGFVPVSFTYHLVYMEIEGDRFNNERINFR